MAPSHNVAVWHELRERSDIDNIIREIQGEFDPYVIDGTLDRYRSARQLLIRLGAVFDVQRAYLQIRPSQPITLKLASYLLSPGLHHAVILRVVRLGIGITIPSQGDANGAILFSHHQQLIAQTLLSTMRAFILRRDSLNSAQWNEIRDFLDQLVRVWSSHAPLPPVEAFVLRYLLPATIETLKRDGYQTRIANLSCGNYELPPYDGGLYPFEIRSSISHDDPIDALRITMEKLGDNHGWLEAYWTLYDVAFAVKAAAIQSQVDNMEGAPPERNASFVNTHARMDEVLTIIEGNVGNNNHSLPEWCGPAIRSLSGSVLGRRGVVTHDRNGVPRLGNDITHRRQVSSGYSDQQLEGKVEAELLTFREFLQVRRLQLRDCNGEVDILYKKLSQGMEKWYRDAIDDRVTSGLSESISNLHWPDSASMERSCVPVYIVDCPNMHPVSRTVLEELLTGDERRNFQDPRQASPFGIDGPTVSCPFCPNQTRIRKARLINPLSEVAPAFRALRSPDQRPAPTSPYVEFNQPPPELYFQPSRISVPNSVAQNLEISQRQGDNSSSPHPISPVQSERPVSGVFLPDQPSPASANPSRQPSRSSRTSSLRKQGGIFPWSKSPSPILEAFGELPKSLAFCFSASGKSVFLWENKNCSDIIKIDGPDEALFTTGRKFSLRLGDPPGSVSVKSIILVAALDNKLAVVADYEKEGRKLFVFEQGVRDVRHEASSNGMLENRTTQCFSLAISRNGTFIALGYGEIVQLYKFTRPGVQFLRAHPIHSTPTGTLVRYQELNFSMDSTKLIAATQEHTSAQSHSVSLRVWKFKDNTFELGTKIAPVAVAVGSADCIGVSAVFLENQITAKCLLAANVAKAYPAVIPTSGTGNRTFPSEMPDYNILSAAQGPSGTMFVVQNGKSKIFELDLVTAKARLLKDFEKDRRRLQSNEEQIALGFPVENTVYALWRKGNDLVLNKIRSSGKRAEVQTEPNFRRVYEDVRKTEAPGA